MTDAHQTQPIHDAVTRGEHALFAQLMESELKGVRTEITGVRNEIQDVAAVSVENRGTLKEIGKQVTDISTSLATMRAVTEDRDKRDAGIDPTWIKRWWPIIAALLGLLGIGGAAGQVAIGGPDAKEVAAAADKAARQAVIEVLEEAKRK